MAACLTPPAPLTRAWGLLTDAEVDALSDNAVRAKLQELSSDALLARVFTDARMGGPEVSADLGKRLLKEVRRNLLGKT